MPHQRQRGVALLRGDRRWALCAGPRAGRSGSWHGQEGDAVTLTAGIDAGSTHTKAVIVDPQGTILGKATVLSGFNFALAAERAFQAALEAGVSRDDVAYVAATGYGRHMVPVRDVA